MYHDLREGGSPADPDSPFTEPEARRVLARAAKEERALSAGVPAAHLREAAIEAGISAAAFDRAVAEVRGAPAHRQRRWGGWRAAILGLTILLGAGTAALQWRVAPAGSATPMTPLPTGDPTVPAGGPAVRGPAVAAACATPTGVPPERLRALADKLYPEVSAPANRHRSLVVALLFDPSCNLKAHVLIRRGADEGTVDAVLGPVFPAAGRGAFQVSGITDVGPWTFERGAPWIVWGMERGPE